MVGNAIEQEMRRKRDRMTKEKEEKINYCYPPLPSRTDRKNEKDAKLTKAKNIKKIMSFCFPKLFKKIKIILISLGQQLRSIPQGNQR